MSPLDEVLLAEAREAQAAQAHALAQADLARVRFAGAVRRLHEGGASMREIARAFKLSHQRVHQLVTGEDKKGRRLGCSFCGLPQKEVRKLIAGPGVYICDECVAAALEVVAGRPGAVRTWAERTEAQPASTGKRKAKATKPFEERACSFCGKTGLSVRFLVGSAGVHICAECLDLCTDIIAELSTPE